jgi:ATP-binding protein involved in chromosome partitioning
MYQKLNVPTLGLVENMSHFVCPSCRHESDIFGKGGGEALASELGVPFLGRIPIYEPIRRGGDAGVPIVVGEPASAAAEAFHAAAERLAAQISIAAYNASQIKRPIALTPVR